MNTQESELKRTSRPFFFGFIGLVGCLAGAILGEIFLALTRGKPVERPVRNELDIVMLIDTSASMTGNPLAEVKEAMLSVIPLVKPRDKVAIVSFDTEARIVQDLTHEKSLLSSHVQLLSADGVTNLSTGLEVSQQILKETDWSSRQPCVLLFSDGEPTESTSYCIGIARKMRKDGVAMMAIGAYGANIGFLKSLVGRNNVINAIDGNLLDAFRQAVQAFQGSHGFMEGNAVFEESGMRRLLRASGWSVLLSIGTILLLLIFQNHLMGNSVLTILQFLFSVGGGLICGLLSGVSTQIIYEGFSEHIDEIAGFFKMISFLGCICMGILLFVLPHFNKKDDKPATVGCAGGVFFLIMLYIFREGGTFVTYGSGIATIFSWAIWGWVITNAIGIAFPNFDRKRAVWAGALGGAIASIGFLISNAMAGETAGRLLGGCCLGFAIGTLVGLLIGSRKDHNGMTGKIITVFDKETGESFTSTVGEERVRMLGKVNGGLEIVTEGDEVSIKEKASGQVQRFSGGVGKLDIGSRFVVSSDANAFADMKPRRPNRNDDYPRRAPNENKGEERRPIKADVPKGAPVSFGAEDKLCILWFGDGSSRYARIVSFLKALSEGERMVKGNVVLLPSALKNRLIESDVKKYLDDSGNQGLLITFMVKQGTFSSRKKIHFLDAASYSGNMRELPRALVLDYEMLVALRSSRESTASLRKLVETETSCLVMVLRNEALLKSEFFNEDAQEQAKNSHPSASRTELGRILLNDMLKKTCGIAADGSKVICKQDSLDNIEIYLKNLVMPNN